MFDSDVTTPSEASVSQAAYHAENNQEIILSYSSSITICKQAFAQNVQEPVIRFHLDQNTYAYTRLRRLSLTPGSQASSQPLLLPGNL